MNNIEIFYHSVPKIGYIARYNTQGMEFDMVNRYIEFLKRKYVRLKKKKIAIFIEPQIDTGYPDIVIVEYYDFHNKNFKTDRLKLSNNDLKILFHIQQKKWCTISELNELLGYSISDIEKCLSRLSNADLIHLSKNKKSVRNEKLHSYCHVNKIISIEAKIDKWSAAICQASKNVWFSTESYILMNKNNCNELAIKECENNGIGVILINGTIETVLKSEKRAFPVSYTSLLFNEWIQRNQYRKENLF